LSLVLASVVVLPAAVAQADALDAAKASGQLGERYDGYLGVVKSDAPAATKALAEDINAKRKTYYGQIAAKENGTTVAAVAAIAGAKLVENAPSGQYVMPSEAAGWKRVP
jgi:uncharacterized protein YdbL (DUF1318 family)